jgi:hypothetical protein
MKSSAVPTLAMASAFGVAVVTAAAALAILGPDAKGIVAALRLTARWSFLLFWAAYVGGALTVLIGPMFAPLARLGRTLGLSYAAAHLVHLGLVTWLYRISPTPPLAALPAIFFATGLLFTYLLAALSFGRASQILGARCWKLLRIVTTNYILLAFAYDFVPALAQVATAYGGLRQAAAYVPFAVMCLAAPLLQIAAAARRRGWLRHVLPA